MALCADSGNVCRSAQFGYLNRDRSVTPVGFFADATPVHTRVELPSARTANAFATDTVNMGEAPHLTLSGRYNRTAVQNRDMAPTKAAVADHRRTRLG